MVALYILGTYTSIKLKVIITPASRPSAPEIAGLVGDRTMRKNTISAPNLRINQPPSCSGRRKNVCYFRRCIQGWLHSPLRLMRHLGVASCSHTTYRVSRLGRTMALVIDCFLVVFAVHKSKSSSSIITSLLLIIIQQQRNKFKFEIIIIIINYNYY